MRISSKIAIGGILILIQMTYTARIKRAHSDNFNVLLNIYKLNPLKHSDVFKKFSNQILLPRPDGVHDMHPNSYESGREKGILKPDKRSMDDNDSKNLNRMVSGDPPKDNDVINLLDDAINETNTLRTPEEKKKHNHFFTNENEDITKFNEINNADTIIL